MSVKLELYRVFKEVADSGNISVAAKNYTFPSLLSANPSSSWKPPCRPVCLPETPEA